MDNKRFKITNTFFTFLIAEHSGQVQPGGQAADQRRQGIFESSSR